jgi:type I restriction enzyme S subunit
MNANERVFRKIIDVAKVTDFVASGSFKSLRKNVEYKYEPDYAVLIRLTDYKSGWNGNFVYVPEHSYQFLRNSNLKPGDIVISNVGAYAGEVFIIPDLGKPITLGPNAIVVKPYQDDSRYLYYYFSSYLGQERIKSIISGSAQPKFNKTDFRNLEIPLPPITTQCKIADILAAYDDLIENNTRRIKMLEEMDQTIYCEWFVHFRFPGHEGVKMVETELGLVPEGWEVKKLGEIAQDNRRSVQPDSVDPETPYIGLEHLPRKSIALSEWGKASEVKSTKFAFRKGEILFGKIRPYFHKVGVAPVDGLCSSDIIVITPKSPEYRAITLACVSSVPFVEQATITSQGTKMPRANWDVLTRYTIAIPPQPIISCFNQISSDIVDLIMNLIFRNRNLLQTRDLLLPKLVSGELDVSDMDIQVE